MMLKQACLFTPLSQSPSFGYSNLSRHFPTITLPPDATGLPSEIGKVKGATPGLSPRGISSTPPRTAPGISIYIHTWVVLCHEVSLLRGSLSPFRLRPVLARRLTSRRKDEYAAIRNFIHAREATVLQLTISLFFLRGSQQQQNRNHNSGRVPYTFRSRFAFSKISADALVV